MNRFSTRLSVFLLAALAGVACLAVEARAQAVDCDNAITQADMNDCARARWQEADARLNQRYRDLLALLDRWDQSLSAGERGGAAKLRDAQRAWIPFRDQACEVAGWPMRGGSAEPLLVYGCLLQLTEQRVADLEQLLDYESY